MVYRTRFSTWCKTTADYAKCMFSSQAFLVATFTHTPSDQPTPSEPAREQIH